MSDDLKRKAIAGFGWRAVERYSVQAARFIVSIVLARILSPHEFGLIALVMVFISFGQVLIDGGFSDALVQSEFANEAIYSSVFFCNIFVGLLSAGVLALSAPFVADFYHEPELLRIIPTLSLNFIISSCGLVYTATLVKRLKFKRLAIISLVSTAVSGCAGVILALNQFGVWALVGQSLCAQLAQVTCLWLVAVWHPRPTFSWSSIKIVAPFGSRILLSTLIDSAYVNLNVVIIGKVYTPATLGFYSRADTLWNMTMSNFSSIISSVSFPILATIKDSPDRLRRVFRSAVEMLAFVSYPAAVGMIVVAHPLVLALLGTKWESCVPFLQLLGGVWVFYPMHAINGSVLMAQGQSKIYLRLQLMKKAVGVMALPLLFQGIYPFIVGQIVLGVFGYYLNGYYSGKLLQYPMSAQLKTSRPYILCALLMGVMIRCVEWLALNHPIVELALQVSFGIVIYLGLCSWFQLPALLKAKELARTFWTRKGTVKVIEATVA